MKEIIASCRSITFLRRIYAACRGAYGIISETYRQSLLFAAEKNIERRLSACFEGSLFLKFILSYSGRNVDFIKESTTCRYGASILHGAASAAYLPASRFYQLKSALAQDLHLAPGRAVGLVLIIAAILNSLLSLFFRNPFSPTAWFFRAMLFALGLAGISMGTDLKTLKENSLIFKILRKINHA
jgi:hypothetical protein